MKHYRVHVSLKVGRKVEKVEDELAALGVAVEFHERHRPRVKRRNGGGLPWSALEHAYLVWSIAKTAIGAWPKIRKVLVGAGLSRNEIITLGLSNYTRTPKKKRKAK